jgi:threonine synthase
MLLQCTEPCGAPASSLREDRVCSCGAPVEIVPERPAQSGAELKALWTSRRASVDPADRSGVWRFRELLPEISPRLNDIVTLGEGNTPVLHGQATAEYVGLSDLLIKHLGWNPRAPSRTWG